MKAYLSRQKNDKTTMKKPDFFNILTLKKTGNFKFFEKSLLKNAIIWVLGHFIGNLSKKN